MGWFISALTILGLLAGISATIRNHGGGDHAPSFPNLNYFLHTNIRYVTVQKVRYTN